MASEVILPTARTNLHILREWTLIAARYITSVLEPFVNSCATYIGPVFISMHDSARPYAARCVYECLLEILLGTSNQFQPESHRACVEHIGTFRRFWLTYGKGSL